ncbi:MAG TPA: DUF4149 domain-containing protein [Terriglobales bacterium]|nr:DUF4149 domain-containing protein [Terriglobales bacterium]
MSFLRYLMLLSLIFWLGGLIFFAFVVAPAAFSVLPTRHLAGNVVARSISGLHWIGIVAAIVYLLSSVLYTRMISGDFRVLAARNLIIVLMLALTLISQFGIMPSMDSLRASLGEIDSVPPDNPARMQFDALHVWSTRMEEGVLLLGLVATYLTANALAKA